jgi:CCR4-NOT transcription complex subunit 1 HEAT repeat
LCVQDGLLIACIQQNIHLSTHQIVQQHLVHMMQEVCDALVATYVTNHPNSSVVLPRMWQLNKDAVLRAMVALYRKDPATVSRSLDVCQELKVLTPVLEETPPPFCLELAALAARREFLNLDKWLTDQFAAKGVSLILAAVSFLDYKLREDSFDKAPSTPTNRIQLSMETLATFLRTLATSAGVMPTDTLQQLKLVQAAAVQVHPELANVVAEAAGMEAFPQDVEEEANANCLETTKIARWDVSRRCLHVCCTICLMSLGSLPSTQKRSCKQQLFCLVNWCTTT